MSVLLGMSPRPKIAKVVLAQSPYAELELELLGMSVAAVMWILKEENRAELWILRRTLHL